MHPGCGCWRELCFPTPAQVFHPSCPVMVPNTCTAAGKGDFVPVSLSVLVFHFPPAQNQIEWEISQESTKLQEPSPKLRLFLSTECLSLHDLDQHVPHQPLPTRWVHSLWGWLVIKDIETYCSHQHPVTRDPWDRNISLNKTGGGGKHPHAQTCPIPTAQRGGECVCAGPGTLPAPSWLQEQLLGVRGTRNLREKSRKSKLLHSTRKEHGYF